MTKTRAVSSTLLLAAVSFATSAAAQDNKAAAPAAGAAVAQAPKPMAAPAPAPAPSPMAKSGTPPGPAARAASPAAPAVPPAAAASATAGAPPAAPPMPAPSKELEAFMKGFEGSWRCETKFPAGAMGPGSPEVATKSTVKINKQFGGMSWHGEYNLPKSKMMPAVSGVFQVGYESGLNQATIVSYDNMGSVTMGLGPLSADSVTFTEEGYMMGMKVKGRETMTKKGPKEVSHKWEIDMGKGFQPMGEDSCKK